MVQVLLGGRRVENYDAGQTVKLSCRNVWKIYGDTSDSFFMDRNGNVDDPQAHVKKILKSESGKS